MKNLTKLCWLIISVPPPQFAYFTETFINHDSYAKYSPWPITFIHNAAKKISDTYFWNNKLNHTSEICNILFQISASQTTSRHDTTTTLCIWRLQIAKPWSTISSPTPCTPPITTLSTSTVTPPSEQDTVTENKNSSLRWWKVPWVERLLSPLEMTMETQKCN